MRGWHGGQGDTPRPGICFPSDRAACPPCVGALPVVSQGIHPSTHLQQRTCVYLPVCMCMCMCTYTNGPLPNLFPPLPSPAGRSRLGYYLYMAQISSLSDPKSISNGRTDGYIHTYMQQQQHYSASSSSSLLFEI